MTTFHTQQSNPGRRARRKADIHALQIHVTNCANKLHGDVHEARKTRCNNFQRAVQSHVMELLLYAKQALPLVWTRVLRLAKSSPKLARSPARRSRDGREPSGKKSGEMSRRHIRATSKQWPDSGNGNAAERPSRRLARQLALRRIWTRNVRAGNLRDNSQLGHTTVAQRPMQHLASDSSQSRRQLSTMTSKNYEHTNHTNARS